MSRITTCLITTNMINNRDIASFAIRKTAYPQLIRKSVNFIKFFFKTDFSITVIDVTSPVPTMSNRVFDNLAEYLVNKFSSIVHNTSVLHFCDCVKFWPIPYWTDEDLEILKGSEVYHGTNTMATEKP